VSNFFLSLILQHIYIKEEEVISFDYYPKYINTIKKEKKIIQRDIYWFLP